MEHKNMDCFLGSILLLLAGVWGLHCPGEAIAAGDNQVTQAVTAESLTQMLQGDPAASVLKKLARKRFSFESHENHQAAALEYQILQNTIARLIPHEYDRPVIDMKFFFNGADTKDPGRVVGILGGTGQLSDAHITGLVIKQLSEDRFSHKAVIHLLSLPPPRTWWEQITGGLRYLYRLSSFGLKGYHRYFMASNTAHLNYSKFRFLSGYSHVFHLPDQVAAVIKSTYMQKNRPSPVLILGTRQAWEGKLYSKIFNRESVPFARLDVSSMLAMQKWIDLVKARPLLQHESQELRQFIRKLSYLFSTTAILLGCTEIPLGLGVLLEKLPRDGLTVFNSEKIFADEIVSTVKTAEQIPQNASEGSEGSEALSSGHR